MQGRASCPSTNNVRPIFQVVVAFQNGSDVFPNRLGHFSREGMKPSPAPDIAGVCMPLRP